MAFIRIITATEMTLSEEVPIVLVILTPTPKCSVLPLWLLQLFLTANICYQECGLLGVHVTNDPAVLLVIL